MVLPGFSARCVHRYNRPFGVLGTVICFIVGLDSIDYDITTCNGHHNSSLSMLSDLIAHDARDESHNLADHGLILPAGQGAAQLLKGLVTMLD